MTNTSCPGAFWYNIHEMKKQQKTNIVFLAALFMTGLFLASPAWALTPAQEEELGKAGLSAHTVGELAALHASAEGGPAAGVTFEEASRLAAEGVPDDIIRLLIRLERVSGTAEAAPFTPAQLRELREHGVHWESIRLLLLSEMRLVREKRNGSGSQSLGREEVTRPDGSRVIVYRSGDPGAPDQDVLDEDEQRRTLELLQLLQFHYFPQKKNRN